MNEKTVISESQVPTLPEHLIVEQILTRLPVKSLLRFKAVSKHWFSTICSHEFQQLQLKFSSLRPQIIIFDIDAFLYPSYLLSYDELNNVKECVELECKYPVPTLPDHSYYYPSYCYVAGSCNGLVCLFDQCFCFFLWNPATNQCHNVRLSDYFEPVEAFPGMGFGYVSSIDDYRIGFLLYENKDVDTDNIVHVYIFSLRAQKWITMAVVDRDFYWSESESVVVDDTIYWPPKAQHDVETQIRILGLNLVSGQLKKFPLMDLFIGYNSVHVSRMKGCLSLCCTKYKHPEGFPCSCFYDVWMLNQPDEWNSWEKVFSLNIGDTNLHSLYLLEMGKFLVSQEQLLTLLDPYEVASEQHDEGTDFCLGSKKGVMSPIIIREAWIYVESLISPFGTFTSNENEDDSLEKERKKKGVAPYDIFQNASM